MTWFAGLLGLFFLAVPIALSLLAMSLLYLGVSGSVSPIIAAQKVATGLDNSALMAIPLFILAAELMNRAGITDRIYRFAKCLVGGVAGGLAYVNVLASLLFASMSGSAVADAMGLGRIEMRGMLREGYQRDFSAAVTASSTLLAAFIPPSISLVIYGVTSGTSIGGLFLAGVMPGLLIAVSLMCVVFVIVRRQGYRRSDPPPWREVREATAGALLPLATPVIIVGGIWGGIFTPTEAGSVAVAYAILLGLYYRDMRVRDLGQVFWDSALSSANIMFIIAVAAVVGWLLTMQRVPMHLAALILDLSADGVVFLLLLNAVLLMLGCFLPAPPVIIMLTPILMPAALAMDIHPIHLGIVMLTALMVGLLTPPVGVVLFAISEVAELPLARLVRALLPFFAVLVLMLLLITFVPALSLSLPRIWGYA